MRTLVFHTYLAACNALLSLPGHALRRFVLRRIVRADLGAGTVVERSVKVTTKGGLEIGERCNINRGVLLDARGGLEVGSLVNISPEALLLTSDHDPGSPAFRGRLARTAIGSRSWIASRAIVLPGARIGEGAIVGAGAVVHGTVEPWTIVAGNPARTVGTRPPDAQASMERYARWLH